jgi:alanyl aminopeptidase
MIDFFCPWPSRPHGGRCGTEMERVLGRNIALHRLACLVTQMEAISARYAFPSFDEPRFKTPFEVTLTVPKEEVAVANTQPIKETASGNGQWKTISFAKTKPLPTYLVAVAVGPWDVVDGPTIAANSVRKQPTALRGIAPRGAGAQLKWVLQQTPPIIAYYENYTQQPYPFDKLDLLGAPDFSAGAMENAGLIVFRDALLRIDANSTASAYRTGFNVNAHEIAHQWFGDLVTVPWWNDIWLNEAFATWAQGKATVDLKPDFQGDLSRLEGTLGAMRSDSLLSARKIRQPILSNDDIQTAFDGITYQKGAAVLRMFEEWLGETNYRQAMRNYLRAHALGSGSSDDLIASIAAASGRGESLEAAMRSFLDQPGIPFLHTKLRCKDGKATLAVSQSRYLPFGVVSSDHLQWKLPVCVRFDRGGKRSKQCFLLDQPAQDFAVDGGCADAYLPNADAVGYYRFAMEETDFAVNHQTRQRYELLAALGATHDAKLGEEARNYGTTPAVAVGEIASLYSSHVAESENRGAFWQWMQTHYDPLAGRFPDQNQSYVLRVAGIGRCSKPQYEELQTWFAQRSPTVIGGQRVAAQSLEAIDQCSALRAHAGANALEGWAQSHR